MSIDIKYDKSVSLLIPAFSCFLYTFDCYQEYKRTKVNNKLKELFKYLRIILSIIATSYLNIIINNEIVKLTGFSHNNFSLSSDILFITTLIMFSIQISLISILFISFIYEFKLLRLNSRKKPMKIIHYFIMFLIPIIFSMKIYDKSSSLMISEINKIFQYILVYSSYTDIPERCQNKSDLEKSYSNIKVAFLDHERMSIAYVVNEKLVFSSTLCKEN